MVVATAEPIEGGAVLDAVRGDDASQFAYVVERYRRQLHVHCYRMLGSFDEAEDVVQETLLRAWKSRRTFDGRSLLRTWLYRIATNACIDALGRRRRRLPSSPIGPVGEVHWLQPYPDRLLEPLAASTDEPESAIVARETIELAFIVAIQHLPPRQRAAFLARDVIGLSATQTAEMMDASQAAVNSALQRARSTVRRHLPESRAEWPARASRDEQEADLLRRYIDASERGDMAAIAALMHEDARFAMPPQPDWHQGRETLVELWAPAMAGPTKWGTWRLFATRANRQPAAAAYLRRTGEATFRAMAVDVLRIEGGLVAEFTTFGSDVFPAFGLPMELPADA